MSPLLKFSHAGAKVPGPQGAEINPAHLVPFGPYGAGQMTGHPVGLVIVIGLLLMGLFSRTPAAFLLLASFLPGGICGLVLWRRHRNTAIGAEPGITLLKL
jgi:hypothetical protein